MAELLSRPLDWIDRVVFGAALVALVAIGMAAARQARYSERAPMELCRAAVAEHLGMPAGSRIDETISRAWVRSRPGRPLRWQVRIAADEPRPEGAPVRMYYDCEIGAPDGELRVERVGIVPDS